MQLINFYILVPILVGIYMMIYQIVVILLLIGTLFKNKIKAESYNLLYVFNTMVAWSSLLVFSSYVAELLIAWYSNDLYELYAFKINILEGDREWVNIISVFSFLFGLMMLFRKLRTKRWFTLLFFLSSCGFLFERIVIFITSLYRDYLPPSWSSYYIYAVIFIMLLLVLIYVWAKKKGRLPFPSVFLK